MNNIYLIDYPNIGEKGLKGIRNLDESDMVYIYHNALFGKATYDVIQDIRLSCAKIELVDTGLFISMLEVQLANAFGQIAVGNKIGCVCVISKRQSLRSLTVAEEYKSCDIVFSESIEKCEIPEHQSEEEEPEALPPHESSSDEEEPEEVVQEEEDKSEETAQESGDETSSGTAEDVSDNAECEA